MTEESILIVGPGAVGKTLAARFLRARRRVFFLGRERRAMSRRVCFHFKDATGNSFIKRGALEIGGAEQKKFSAIFLCVKSADFRRAASSAFGRALPKAAVVCLQNGLGQERRLRFVFGQRRAVVGSCYFSAEKRPDGSVVHHGGDKIELAENARNKDCARRAARLLRLAGWTVSARRSERRMLWTKLCLNAAINPVGALAKASNGAVVLNPALRKIAEAALKEASLAAKAGGCGLSFQGLKKALRALCPRGSEQKNSMLQDLEAGRPTEARWIFGPLLAAAGKKRVPLPILSRMARLILALEKDLCGPSS